MPSGYECAAQDAYGSPLTFSGGDSDTLMLALLRASYSGRHDATLAASVEQALPVQPAWLNFNRLRLRAERSVPLGGGVSAQLCAKGAPLLHPAGPTECVWGCPVKSLLVRLSGPELTWSEAAWLRLHGRPQPYLGWPATVGMTTLSYPTLVGTSCG